MKPDAGLLTDFTQTDFTQLLMCRRVEDLISRKAPVMINVDQLRIALPLLVVMRVGK
jgi:hypothetical protein